MLYSENFKCFICTLIILFNFANVFSNLVLLMDLSAVSLCGKGLWRWHDIERTNYMLTSDQPLPLTSLTLPSRLGQFDFQKFCLIFAPGVSIILFFIYNCLEELSALKIKNCLDAKWVNLYSEIGKKNFKLWFYIIKLPILRPDNF